MSALYIEDGYRGTSSVDKRQGTGGGGFARTSESDKTTKSNHSWWPPVLFMREFSDCPGPYCAAAESPVIALVKSRVMPESVYNTHRFLQIKTRGDRASERAQAYARARARARSTQQSARAWSSADDARRNGSKSNDTPPTRDAMFSILLRAGEEKQKCAGNVPFPFLEHAFSIIEKLSIGRLLRQLVN